MINGLTIRTEITAPNFICKSSFLEFYALMEGFVREGDLLQDLKFFEDSMNAYTFIVTHYYPSDINTRDQYQVRLLELLIKVMKAFIETYNTLKLDFGQRVADLQELLIAQKNVCNWRNTCKFHENSNKTIMFETFTEKGVRLLQITKGTLNIRRSRVAKTWRQ